MKNSLSSTLVLLASMVLISSFVSAKETPTYSTSRAPAMQEGDSLDSTFVKDVPVNSLIRLIQPLPIQGNGGRDPSVLIENGLITAFDFEDETGQTNAFKRVRQDHVCMILFEFNLNNPSTPLAIAPQNFKVSSVSVETEGLFWMNFNRPNNYSLICRSDFTVGELKALFESVVQQPTLEVATREKLNPLGGIVVDRKTGSAIAARCLNTSNPCTSIEVVSIPSLLKDAETDVTIIGDLELTQQSLSEIDKTLVVANKSAHKNGELYSWRPYYLTTEVSSLAWGMPLIEVFVPFTAVIDTAVLPFQGMAYAVDQIVLKIQDRKLKKALKFLFDPNQRGKNIKLRDPSFGIFEQGL